MTTTFSELQTMQDSLSGGTTNLLRMARSGCGCAVAFVALALEDRTFATARYSSTPDEGLVGREALDELVSQIWRDPRIARGEPVTQAVQLGGRWAGRGAPPLAVAVVPLGGDAGEPWGMVGVADPGDKIFGPSDIELLGRIAKRMASYLRARHELQHQEAAATPRPEAPSVTPPAGRGTDRATRSELWWSVEPGEGPAGAGGAGGAEGVAPAPGEPRAGTTWATLAAEAADELRGTFGIDRSAGPGAGETAQSAPTQVPPPPRADQVPPAPPAFRARVVAEAPTEPRPTARAFEVPAAEPPARADRTVPYSETGGREPGPPATIESGSAGVGTTAEPDPYRDLLAEEDLPPGLIPVGALLGRTGRMLGAGGSAAGSLAVVAVEVEGAADRVTDLVPAAVRELRSQLRFDDPLARIGRGTFVAVVPLVPGGSSGELVEARLAEALRAGAFGREVQIRSAHVVADIRASHDADELLRSAVGKLRAD
jgi:hypothetical protein